MYMSCLLIDVGSNPDRPRPGRLWLRNAYHVHQRLCMAFPSASRKSDQVHVKRGAGAGFLFRIDPQPGGGVAILVLSAVKPDWDYAFRNACYLLSAPPEVKPFNTCFAKGQRLRFRLAANPTRRLSKNSMGPDGKPVKEALIGKRVPVPFGQLKPWLAKRGEEAGFAIDMDSTVVQPSYVYVNKPWNGKRCDKCGGPMKEDGQGKEMVCEKCEARVQLFRHRLLSVRFDGVLTVTDPDEFQKIFASGIGSGKAFGFGLLSVAPDRPSFPEEST
ncbi:MAG: type I-E CRISPR-associated protein Cas6/Cse3/CasE [Nitrospinae bacterium]|nr:type I-E CRISPR-associated protein Cas6/Cse3/CasE [Nitrospinota bacterium]